MRNFYIIISFFVIVACKQEAKEQHLTKITSKTILIDSTVGSVFKIEKVVNPYRNKMISEIEKELCFAPKNLVRTDGNMQSTLGNLMADMNLQIANKMYKKKTGRDIDFAMFNYGGIRAGLPKGMIKVKHAFQLMPFENSLVVVELSGQKVVELINYFIKGNKAHPLSNTIRLAIQKDKFSLTIKGQKFDSKKTYTVLTSDYLQHGGDRMDFFKKPLKLTKLDYRVRDAILQYFTEKDTLISTLDNRVITE